MHLSLYFFLRGGGKKYVCFIEVTPNSNTTPIFFKRQKGFKRIEIDGIVMYNPIMIKNIEIIGGKV